MTATDRGPRRSASDRYAVAVRLASRRRQRRPNESCPRDCQDVVTVRDDTRGRVPFALLGVLQLVSSLTLAPAFVSEPAPSETAVERALDEATAETQVAVRDGVSTAGQQAAANPASRRPTHPLVGSERLDSVSGRARIRAYLRVADRLERVSGRRGDVTVTASLPAVLTSRSPCGDTPRLGRTCWAERNRDAGDGRGCRLTVRRNGAVVSTRRVRRLLSFRRRRSCSTTRCQPTRRG